MIYAKSSFVCFYNKDMDRTAAFYSRPSYMSGGGAIFAGARRQRGGSILGALKKVVKPFANNFGKSIKSNALGLAKDVIGDVVKGRNIGSSLLTRGKQRGLKTLKQTVMGVGPSKKKTVPKRLAGRKQRGRGKRRAPRKKPSRKRHASRKHTPRTKRRRCNF